MILSIKSWRTKKKLHKPVIQIYWPNYKREDSVYIHVYQVIKSWGPGPQNSLRHTDNRKYFLRLSLTQNRGKAHMFYLARKVRQIWRCSCWGKGNSTMINELKYGQTWTIWPSHLVYHLTKPLKVMKPITQQAFTSSKLTIEALEQGMKYVQS